MNARQAFAIVEAAQTKAANLGISVSVAVLDAGGNLKAFLRMDGSWLGSIDVALKKARTSVLFEIETQKLWEFAKPEGQAHGIEITNEGLVSFGGGIPLKNQDGKLAGAVGVSGGLVEQDMAVATTAAESFKS